MPTRRRCPFGRCGPAAGGRFRLEETVGRRGRRYAESQLSRDRVLRVFEQELLTLLGAVDKRANPELPPDTIQTQRAAAKVDVE